MNKLMLGISSLMIATIISASSISEVLNNIVIDGYIRAAYEKHQIEDGDASKDGAIGGKLHMETTPYYGLSIGGSFYTSNAIGASDNHGLVPFRGEVASSYNILGEAYIKAQLDNTLITLGRQELDTPFAQVDDIGMIPNTFEAYILENKDIADTTLFVGQIQKMAGVGAKVVDDFTRVNDDDNMQVLGITHEGIQNLELSVWYYHLKDAEIDNIGYVEASYKIKNTTVDYNLGIQYAKQTYSTQEDTSIYGIMASANHIAAGVTFTAAYNKVEGNAVTSGFGGGPFFSNSEYLVIDNTGTDGSQAWFGLEYDTTNIGANGIILSLSKAILKNQVNKKSTEVDIVARYEVNKKLTFHMIYSDLDGVNVNEDTAKHLRVFANYTF